MRHPSELHDYQVRAINHQIEHPRNFLWLFMGAGKQQPVTEPVLTPGGWRAIGAIQPGDYVIGSNGQPTRVLGVFPQLDTRVYKVTFNDGSSTRCGPDHLWTVTSPTQRRRDIWQTLTTEQLLDGGLRDGAGNRRWHIPVVEPVEHPTQELPIDPYLLGVIMGDGHVQPSGVTSLCTDREILTAVGATCRPHESSQYTGYGHVANVKDTLVQMGVAGCRSWEKWIPHQYLVGDISQRLDLLQGLLDTDGSPMGNGGVEFSSTSESLTDSVVSLVQSLGGIARKKGPRFTTHQGGQGRASWRVNVKLPAHLSPFRLQRKLEKWKHPGKYKPARLIESIERVDSERSVCILVEAADHLYVTRDYVVTHNTVVTLSTIAHLRQHRAIRAALVVAPLRVATSVWAQEAAEWSHTKHLRFSIIAGNPQERMRALTRPADVYVTNYENLVWLATQLRHYYIRRNTLLPFDMLVLDESSKMKNIKTKRMQALAGNARENLESLLPYFWYRTGLTGTPATNGLEDLFGQFLVIDNGERLGVSFENYLANYFRPADNNGYRYEATEEGSRFIYQRVSDIVLEMKEEDYITLPPLVVNDIYVNLKPRHRDQYEQLEREFFTELDAGVELEVTNEAAKSNKLLQFSNGAAYTNTETREWEVVHDAKLDALEEIVEEAEGEPILLAYAYKPDAARILKRFPFAKNISGMSARAFEETKQRWLDGKERLLIGHPASMGHGIDGLQKRGNIMVWFGLNWSLELYLQFMKRIHRQGQERRVVCHRILTNDTLDDAVKLALDVKTQTQDDLRAAVAEYRRNKLRIAA